MIGRTYQPLKYSMKRKYRIDHLGKNKFYPKIIKTEERGSLWWKTTTITSEYVDNNGDETWINGSQVCCKSYEDAKRFIEKLNGEISL